MACDEPSMVGACSLAADRMRPRARCLECRREDGGRSSAAQRAVLNWRLAARVSCHTIGAMIDDISRRDWLKAMGVAGAGALIPFDAAVAEATHTAATAARASAAQHASGEIVELTSTSEIFIP